MSERACTGGKHWPPATGGSCDCGMVTRIPARRSGQDVPLRDLLARSMDGSTDPVQAANRLLAALAAAGLTVAPSGAASRSA